MNVENLRYECRKSSVMNVENLRMNVENLRYDFWPEMLIFTRFVAVFSDECKKSSVFFM